MTYDSRISKLEEQTDALDREYYRAKLEELSWCLPVVRAVKKWRTEVREGTESGVAAAEWKLVEAIDALERAEEVDE
jgi:hypothetical protein